MVTWHQLTSAAARNAGAAFVVTRDWTWAKDKWYHSETLTLLIVLRPASLCTSCLVSALGSFLLLFFGFLSRCGVPENEPISGELGPGVELLEFVFEDSQVSMLKSCVHCTYLQATTLKERLAAPSSQVFDAFGGCHLRALGRFDTI